MENKTKVNPIGRAVGIVITVCVFLGMACGLINLVRLDIIKQKELAESRRNSIYSSLGFINVAASEYTYFKYTYDSAERMEEIGDGHFIYSDKLELLLHLYSTYWSLHDGDLPAPPTKDEIINLYLSFDDDMYDRFITFKRWACYCAYYFDDYENALRTAKTIYDQKNGLYKGKLHYGELTANERIELADYILENPGFMPEEIYSNELKLFEPMTPEVFDRIADESGL